MPPITTTLPSASAGLLLFFCVLLFSTLLNGCTSWQGPAVGTATEQLLLRHQVGSLAAGPSRANNIAKARQEFSTTSSLTNRLQLALLLSSTQSTSDERDEALALLEPCDDTTADDAALINLCVLTRQLVRQERQASKDADELRSRTEEYSRRQRDLERQLGAVYAQSAAKVEAEQRERVSALEEQLLEQRTQLESLRRQINELRDIERSIGERQTNEGNGA